MKKIFSLSYSILVVQNKLLLQMIHKRRNKIRLIHFVVCILCSSTTIFAQFCPPTTGTEAAASPGILYTNPPSCNVQAGEPSVSVITPNFVCGLNEVEYQTLNPPENSGVLYHYWGNCANSIPVMPSGISAQRNGYIEQMFCATDSYGLPAYPDGLSNISGQVDFLPTRHTEVGCDNFLNIGTCQCGGNSSEEIQGAELIQLDFWLAVPNAQTQIGMRLSGGNADAGAFFVGADLDNMCKVAYHTDGSVFSALPEQPIGTYNLPNDINRICGLSVVRVRLYYNDIAGGFTVTPELNIGRGWEGLANLFIFPATAVDDNITPTVSLTTKVGFINTDGNIFDINGIYDPLACNPVPTTIDYTNVDGLSYNADFGDLPTTSTPLSNVNYTTLSTDEGPAHLLACTDLYLGASVENEIEAESNLTASGDTGDDGIIFPTHILWSVGNTVRIPFTVVNNSSLQAELEIWMDWNGDGDFNDANEWIIDLSDDTNGDFGQAGYLTIPIPSNATTAYPIGFRARLSHQNDMTPNGLVNSGEVEDYLVRISCNNSCEGFSVSKNN